MHRKLRFEVATRHPPASRVPNLLAFMLGLRFSGLEIWGVFRVCGLRGFGKREREKRERERTCMHKTETEKERDWGRGRIIMLMT